MLHALKKLISASILVATLTACASLEEMKDSNQHSMSAKLAKYTNQLVQDNQPYATLKTYPFVPRYGFATLDVEPTNVYQIDNTVLVGEKYLLNNYFALRTPHEQVKIPAGIHTVIAGGRDGYVKFNNVDFEAGKHYVLYPETHISWRKRTWRIYEYTPDNRFNGNEKESVILGNPVTDEMATQSKKEVL